MYLYPETINKLTVHAFKCSFHIDAVIDAVNELPRRLTC